MFTRLVLCVLGAALWATSAQACTLSAFYNYNYNDIDVSPINAEGYSDSVDPNQANRKPVTSFERLLFQADSIHISRVKLEPVSKSGEKWENTAFAHATFVPESVLKGANFPAFEYFSDETEIQLVVDVANSQGKWPTVAKKLTTQTAIRINQHENSFSFWDQIPIRSPTIISPEHKPICSPVAFNTLVPDQLYLVVESRGVTELIEPIRDHEDQLVLSVQRFLSGVQENARKEISPEDYFANMAGIVEFRIQDCPSEILTQTDRYNSSPLNRVSSPAAQLGIQSLRTQFEKSPIDAAHLKEHDGALFAYYYNSEDKIKCEPNQKFLAFWKEPEHELERINYDFDIGRSRTPPMRFARIEGDNLLIKDIKTNYILNADDPVTVDQVFSWVADNSETQ